MGSLPRERVNPSFPFLHTGIDYCGPFFIRHQRKGTYQRIYVAIFVCLASKAVHLEIVSDSTTDAFLATLKRFVARRGKCATISSDNAKNFVGANRELKRLHNLLKFPEEKLSSYLSSEGISWNFMPPRAQNFGGLWEAGIVGILNSRPITPLSEDIDDWEVLTPGHFLIGRPITSISEPNLLDKTENTLSRWQKLTKIVQHIWTKWSRDYLNNLQQRNKWQFHKDNVKLNTMVLIKDDNLPVNKWSLGRITKLVPGTDGKVRAVEIKTNKGNIKRSIGKVCVLPLDN
ncbi:integrase catalytic domain-containing protein [Trichonephila clavipes]|nr:integrase catalytic domain-containing protein [Trichonephila clavipes]